MTPDEIEKSASQLNQEDLELFNHIKLGRWAVASDAGLYNIYDTKAEAISALLADHDVSRKNCRVKRNLKGWYTVMIQDCDDPSWDFYDEFEVERIRPWNLTQYQELALAAAGREDIEEE